MSISSMQKALRNVKDADACEMGKKNGCLIEGMACPGGCVAGAGTNIAIPQAIKEVNNFKAHSEKKIPEMEENHD